MAYLVAPSLPLKLLMQFVSANQAAAALGIAPNPDAVPDFLRLASIGLFRIAELNDAVKALAAEGAITIIHEDRRVRLGWPELGRSSHHSQQEHLRAIGFEENKRVNAGDGIRIGLIDSGVDTTHPEFAADVVEEAADVTAGGATPIAAAAVTDPTGHGTQVASLAVGLNLGLAPKAKLVVARLGADAVKGYQTAGAVCEAINWLIQKRDDGEPRAHVINMSLVCDTLAPADLSRLFSGLGNKRSLVAATGNWGAHCQDTCGLPARMLDIIGVGATQTDGTVDAHGELVWSVWPDSGWGYHADTLTPRNYVPKPDLHAPGKNVVTARVRDAAQPGVMYGLTSGTSMSSGLVSGALAAIYSAGFNTPHLANKELLRLARCLRTERPGGLSLSLRGL